MDADKPLTDEQLRFCHEYAADPSNATRAYMRAFKCTSYRTAKSAASRLLTYDNIQAEIEVARRDHQRACRVDAGRTLRALVAAALCDPADAFEEDADGALALRPLSRVPARVRQAIQAIKFKRRRLRSPAGDTTQWEVEEVEYKLVDKLGALDRLCKHLGLTKDGAALEELLRAISGSRAAAPAPAPPADPIRPDHVADRHPDE